MCLWPDGLDGAGPGLLSASASLLLASVLSASSAFTANRWPSNTVVQQLRSLTVNEAQIFAAAAASLMGPATNRNCMPSPLVLSLITMIGRSFVSAALAFDLRSPCQSARKPGIELAPPTSTPNSVCWTVSSGTAETGAASVSAAAVGAAAVTSGIGAVFASFGGMGDSISFPAAGSGGAIIDFDAISEPDGWADAACGALVDFAAGFGSAGVAATACLSCFSVTAGAVAATGPTIGAGDGFAAAVGGSADEATTGATKAVGTATAEGVWAGGFAEGLLGAATPILD